MIKSNKIIVSTQSATIECSIDLTETKSEQLIKYEEKKKFDLLCKNGCPNYNKKWSCPPLSPSYSNFVSEYENIIIVVFSTKLDQFHYIKNDYLKVKAANTIMKSRIDKVLRSFVSNDRYYISTGSCRMCKPCKRKLNQPCAHPGEMTFSFEALGINVSEMVSDLFDFELKWYKKNSLPEYTSVVAGIIYNDVFDANLIFNELLSLN